MCASVKRGENGLGKTLKTRFSAPMTAPRLITAAHRALTFVVLVSVMLLSFGHRHDAVAEPLDPADAAFVASGGQISDLCALTGTSETGSGVHCPACVLGQDVDLPSQMVLVSRVPTDADQAELSHIAQLTRHIAFDFSRTSRAPPVL